MVVIDPDHVSPELECWVVVLEECFINVMSLLNECTTNSFYHHFQALYYIKLGEGELFF